MLGISRQTLYKDLELVNQDQVAKDLLAYRAGFNQALPIPDRVTKYVGLTSHDNPFAALKALQRIDALSGIHAQPEKASTDPAASAISLFELPFGTRVAIEIGGHAKPAKRLPTPTRPPASDSSD